jgi:hypothetical protein
MVKLRVCDGISFEVNADFNDFLKQYRRALAKRVPLEITNRAGKKRIVNPIQVLYFEEI